MAKVKDIMHTGDANAVVSENSCFRDVLEELNAKRLGAVSVVDDNQRLIGLITDGDVRRTILKTQDTLPELFMKNVSTLMGRQPKIISPEAELEECLQVLEEYSFWVVPVVGASGVLLGMVHMHPLLKAMAK